MLDIVSRNEKPPFVRSSEIIGKPKIKPVHGQFEGKDRDFMRCMLRRIEG
jgi:hypothetical protein